MNAIVPAQPRSVTIDMANRYGMEPGAFEATLRNTIMPVQRGQVMQATREEFAAFLLVAREYRLNPITRQIYCFPKKGGGIIPVVSVDGWAFLINEHPAFDGMEFEDNHDEKGKLLSVTCKIYRKDRRMPVVVTEYLVECKRDTDPWQMQHRMLRHKALIQCARYAFAFSGIYDEDEAERFAAIPAAGSAMAQQVPPPAPRRQVEQQAPQPVIEHRPEEAPPAAVPHVSDDERERIHEAELDAGEDGIVTREAQLAEIDDRLGFARTAVEVEEAYTDSDAEAVLSDYPGGVEEVRALKEKHLDRVQGCGALKPDPVDDFPGNDAIAARDPFAIPAEFKSGEHYQNFIRGAAAAAQPGDMERLRSVWNDTKGQRKYLKDSWQLAEVDRWGLEQTMRAALERVTPPAADEAADTGDAVTASEA